MGNSCSSVCAQISDCNNISFMNRTNLEPNLAFPNWTIDSDESIILDPVDIQPKALIRRYLILKLLRAIPLFLSFLNQGKAVNDAPATHEKILMLESGLPAFHAVRIKGQTIENFATVYLNEGGCYSGQWDISQQRPEGFGIMVYTDNSKYFGTFRSGKKSGRGRLISLNGNIYEGDFFNDKAQGEGILRKSDGTVYSGGFLNDLEHGEGTLVYLGKKVYTGGFVRGQKHGYGKLLIGVNSYTGDFLTNQFDGNGKYIWADGRSYDGGWKSNKMHGYGEFIYADGKSYAGHYSEGIREGFGSFNWGDDREYKGGWSQGKMHGEGTYIFIDKGRKRNFVALYELGKRKKILKY